MARFITTLNEGFDFTSEEDGPGLGFKSATDFRFRHEVTAAERNGFVVDYGDGTEGVFGGRALSYRDVTRNGHTMETPFRGTITSVIEDEGLALTGLKLRASDFYKATRTANDADNFALFEKALNGNDVFVFKGRGDDILSTFRGSDRVKAGRGDDIIDGGAGNDRLEGEAGADILIGGAGRDRLFGGNGDDELNGGKGNDILTGGRGRDAFVYDGARMGRDMIRDFNVRQDDVVIDAVAGVDGFADLKVLTVRGDGAVRFAGTTVIFDGLDADQINARMFDFG